jgi:phosphoglycerate dehydrogenase-like enzyme
LTLSAAAIVERAPSDCPLPIEMLRRADGVILRGPAKLTADLLSKAESLRVIGAMGSGADNIDLDAATALGIPVVHGAGVAPRAVAEYVLAAIVMTNRKLIDLHNLCRSGQVNWTDRQNAYCGDEASQTVLGVVGYGHIGRMVARLAHHAFGMRVLIFDPQVYVEEELGIERVESLYELLAESSTVSIHVPLNDLTRNLIGRDELRLLGAGGVIINTSRGGIVNECELIEALKNGEIGSAMLDVFDGEPPSSDQLVKLGAVPNLYLTPHIAGVTWTARQALSRSVVEGVLRALNGERPAALANPNVVFPDGER